MPIYEIVYLEKEQGKIDISSVGEQPDEDGTLKIAWEMKSLPKAKLKAVELYEENGWFFAGVRNTNKRGGKFLFSTCRKELTRPKDRPVLKPYKTDPFPMFGKNKPKGN